MNILCIGNSFSEDATRYLHQIARADGRDLNAVNLFVGGCSLELHYNNMLSNKKAYELGYNGVKTGFFVSLSEALCNREWDIITLQQVSALSFVKESYQPYITELIGFVRKKAPSAKIYLHQTWAYEDDSDRLKNLGRFESAKEMLGAIIHTNNEIANEINAEKIIRSGELLGLLAEHKTDGRLHRDTYHASLGLGRYALGLLWYRTVFGVSVAENSFKGFDEPISEKDISLIKKLVDNM